MYLRYVAIGDSTTEGLDDPDGQGGYRGWANRLAEELAALEPDFRYANLAVRGLLTRQIRETQLERALSMKPDLATVVAGVNDLLRPRFDLAQYTADLEAMIAALRAQGAEVLTFTMPDLSPVMPLARPLRGRLNAMNAAIRAVAQRHGARLADLAQHEFGSDPRLWSDDRLHANSDGHARIAEALAEALELPGATHAWATPLPPAPPRKAHQLAQAELAWARGHLLPWLARHLRGRSSSDGRVAKRPELATFRPRSPA